MLLRDDAAARLSLHRPIPPHGTTRRRRTGGAAGGRGAGADDAHSPRRRGMPRVVAVQAERNVFVAGWSPPRADRVD